MSDVLVDGGGGGGRGKSVVEGCPPNALWLFVVVVDGGREKEKFDWGTCANEEEEVAGSEVDMDVEDEEDEEGPLTSRE